MTISEMHNGVKQELDKTSSLELPAFEEEEIDYWLNQTILTFINQRYGGVNIKGTGIEETQKRIEDLRTLVVNNDLISSASTYYPNNYCFDLPSDYYLLLTDQVDISYTSDITGQAGSKRVGTTPTTLDRYTVMLRDPFSEHIFYKDYACPLRLIQDTEMVFITDGTYTITDSRISYIKNPATVDLTGVVNCDLPNHTHQEIVKMTANKMLENIESPRYATIEREVHKME